MVTQVNSKRAVGYIRVSTGKQARSDRSSLETQEQRIRQTVTDSGNDLVEVFSDVESGRRDDRPEYRRMLDFVAENSIDVVYVQYLDRFGRNTQEILSRIWRLKEARVAVEATDQDIKGELMLLIQAGFAAHESRRTGERVRINMRNSAKKGVHSGPPPYGLSPVREIRDGKAVVARWEIDESQAEIVREMRRLSVDENLGFKAIADSLNERGMTRNGRHWVPASVQLILRNPALKGTMVFGRTRRKDRPPQEPIEVPGVFPPILTHQEWNDLQTRLDIRQGAPRGSVHRSQYLLSGVARCGHCGGPLTGKAGARRKDGTLYRSYLCVNAKKAKAACAFHNSHSARKLELAVLDHLGQFSDPRRVAELMKDSGAKELKRKRGELSQLEKRLAELDRDFHKNLDLLKKELLTEEEFALANSARRDERVKTEMRLAEVRSEIATAESVKGSLTALPERIAGFQEAFEALDVPKAKAMLQMILKAVYVWNDNRVELEFR